MCGRARRRRDGARLAGDGRTHRGRRRPARARSPPEAPRQPGSRLHLKGLRGRPWGDRRKPRVARGDLDHATRARPHARPIRPGRERLTRPHDVDLAAGPAAERHRSRRVVPLRFAVHTPRPRRRAASRPRRLLSSTLPVRGSIRSTIDRSTRASHSEPSPSAAVSGPEGSGVTEPTRLRFPSMRARPLRVVSPPPLVLDVTADASASFRLAVCRGVAGSSSRTAQRSKSVA